MLMMRQRDPVFDERVHAWQGSKTMGSGSAVFLGIRDQAAPYLWDQGGKLARLLESRIRNWRKKWDQRWKSIRHYQPVHELENESMIDNGHAPEAGGGGGYSRRFWVGVCRPRLQIWTRFIMVLHSKWYPVLEKGNPIDINEFQYYSSCFIQGHC